jgi:hypothetical protein
MAWFGLMRTLVDLPADSQLSSTEQLKAMRMAIENKINIILILS